MVFDFFGDKMKVVIAMAHIGALPGSPLYDADGGVSKLIDGVLKDIEALQAGGVDAIMFGNENDRPYVLKAPPEGVAGMTAVVQAVKPHLHYGLAEKCGNEFLVDIGGTFGNYEIYGRSPFAKIGEIYRLTARIYFFLCRRHGNHPSGCESKRSELVVKADQY